MFKHVDMDAAMRRLAERKIEAAIEEGKFSNLEGAGKPIELEPMPADENARLMWWALRLLKKNDVVPDEVKYRKTISALRDRFVTASDESTLRRHVAEANVLIDKLNTMGTNAIPSDVARIDVEAEVTRWRARQRS